MYPKEEHREPFPKLKLTWILVLVAILIGGASNLVNLLVKRNEDYATTSANIQRAREVIERYYTAVCGHPDARCIRDVCYLNPTGSAPLVMRTVDDKPLSCAFDAPGAVGITPDQLDVKNYQNGRY